MSIIHEYEPKKNTHYTSKRGRRGVTSARNWPRVPGKHVYIQIGWLCNLLNPVWFLCAVHEYTIEIFRLMRW